MVLVATVWSGAVPLNFTVPPLKARPPICWSPSATVVTLPASARSVALVSAVVLTPPSAKVPLPTATVPAKAEPVVAAKSNAWPFVSVVTRPLPVSWLSSVKAPGVLSASVPLSAITAEPSWLLAEAPSVVPLWMSNVPANWRLSPVTPTMAPLVRATVPAPVTWFISVPL
ncbi:hypothetical protein D3C81_1423600 [compost metagenome]